MYQAGKDGSMVSVSFFFKLSLISDFELPKIGWYLREN